MLALMKLSDPILQLRKIEVAVFFGCFFFFFFFFVIMAWTTQPFLCLSITINACLTNLFSSLLWIYRDFNTCNIIK